LKPEERLDRCKASDKALKCLKTSSFAPSIRQHGVDGRLSVPTSILDHKRRIYQRFLRGLEIRIPAKTAFFPESI
jgi:hypothetical protein